MYTKQLIIKKSTLQMKSIITLLLVFMGSSAFSQSLTANEVNGDWTLITEQDGIKMYVQKGECQMGNIETPFTYGFLKVENTKIDDKNTQNGSRNRCNRISRVKFGRGAFAARLQRKRLRPRR